MAYWVNGCFVYRNLRDKPENELAWCLMLTEILQTDSLKNLTRDWSGRIPIVVGGIGHRDIDRDNNALSMAVRAQCLILRKRYKHSPFVILSALAEGADRLIAEIAMEVLKADLIAVLPMPADDYERDFVREASKTEFRELLAKALCIKLAPTPEDRGLWSVDGEPRNEQYARAGAIIADHAQIYFAIWDKQPARGIGGTADQVAWFDRGYSPAKYSLYTGAMSPLDPPEPGRRIHIDPASATVEVLEGPNRRAKGRKSDISSILSRIDDYNKDVLKYEATLISNPLVTNPDDDKNVIDLALTHEVYRKSDSISGHYASLVRKIDASMYLLVLPAIITFNFLSSDHRMPLVYLLITIVMLFLGLRVWFRGIDNRFLEYRCLAEAMRTLFFWRYVGVTRSVWLAYLSRQSGIVHWIRHAVRNIEFCQDCMLVKKADRHVVASDRLEDAKTLWVTNQENWFKAKRKTHFRRVQLWK